MQEALPEKYRSVIAPDEKILYVSREKGSMIKPDLKKRLMPDVLAVTDRRLIYFQPKGLVRGALGMGDYIDFPYMDMKNIELDRGMRRATLKIHRRTIQDAGKVPKIEDIDKKDAEDIFGIVREILTKREQEERKPIIIQTQTETRSSDDPMEKLRKLGQLKESGIISDAEFEQKKKELLAKL